MTPELLTFLAAIKSEDITTLYGMIEEPENVANRQPTKPPFMMQLKRRLKMRSIFTDKTVCLFLAKAN